MRQNAALSGNGLIKLIIVIFKFNSLSHVHHFKIAQTCSSVAFWTCDLEVAGLIPGCSKCDKTRKCMGWCIDHHSMLFCFNQILFKCDHVLFQALIDPRKFFLSLFNPIPFFVRSACPVPRPKGVLHGSVVKCRTVNLEAMVQVPLESFFFFLFFF